MPDCPGKEERREGLSIPWAGGWTQTGLKLETQGKMSCPGSDAWAVLWSLKEEMKDMKRENGKIKGLKI